MEISLRIGPQGASFTVCGVHRSGEMGNWFTSRIAELAVYNRALAEEELVAISLPE